MMVNCRQVRDLPFWLKDAQQLWAVLDDAVGYRVLDADEELEFSQQCAERNNPNYLHQSVVRYYGKKSE